VSSSTLAHRRGTRSRPASRAARRVWSVVGHGWSLRSRVNGHRRVPTRHVVEQHPYGLREFGTSQIRPSRGALPELRFPVPPGSLYAEMLEASRHRGRATFRAGLVVVHYAQHRRFFFAGALTPAACLGSQGGRYVAPPSEWAIYNFRACLATRAYSDLPCAPDACLRSGKLPSDRRDRASNKRRHG